MYKFGMAEDDSTYIYTEDVSESAKPSTPDIMNVQHLYPSNKTLCKMTEENQTAS